MDNLNETAKAYYDEWFDCQGDLDDFIFYWEEFTPTVYEVSDKQI